MPTREAAVFGVLTVLLLFVAVNLQAGWVYAVAALLVGFAATGWLSTVTAARGLPVRRSMPAEAVEGEAVRITLRAGPVRWPRFFLRITDAVPGCDPGEVVLPLLGRGEAALTYRTTARKRGIHRVASVDVATGGITGLFRLRRPAAAPGTITILPRYAVLRRFPLPGRPGPEAAPFVRPERTGIDVAGVRDFREGDDAARIHWRSTARRGSLVVREFEREVAPAAGLIVDARPAGDGEAIEDLIRAAASVAYFIARRGQAIRLAVARGGRVEVAAVGWMDALRALAAVEPGPGPDATALGAALPTGMPAVLFTASSDAAAAVAASGRPLAAVLARPDEQGTLLLEAMGVPVRVLRAGAEVAGCLES